MINKTIHYCWFGKNEKDKKSLDCIESWRRFCPNYEIMEWNEGNFDITSNIFVKEAYEKGKWAFVTDYVRLYVLYKYGGIYMDTDVELIKNIDCFLDNEAFSGFENNNLIPTGLMASKKGNEWIKHLLDYYEHRHFVNEDGTLNTSPNTGIITTITAEIYDVKMNNSYQQVQGVLTIYPSEYFCPKSHETGLINITNNTYCIHHFNASWLSAKEKEKMKKEQEYLKKYKNILWSDMTLIEKFKRAICHVYTFGISRH